MKPDISEFSYGFALTNEMIGWAPIVAAPIFPSLIEEGRPGGGYDLQLDMPGIPLFVQFKRADCMIRSTASEYNRADGNLSLPYYRFKITESSKSQQHEMLLELEDENNIVVYAAPRFHLMSEINSAWFNGQIASQSIFVAPSAIGRLDENAHHVAYDHSNAYLFSQPKKVSFLSSIDLAEKLLGRLKSKRMPLRKALPQMLSDFQKAKKSVDDAQPAARHRLARRGFQFVTESPTAQDTGSSKTVEQRAVHTLSESLESLRQLADSTAQTLNSQLIIVQRRPN